LKSRKSVGNERDLAGNELSLGIAHAFRVDGQAWHHSCGIHVFVPEEFDLPLLALDLGVVREAYHDRLPDFFTFTLTKSPLRDTIVPLTLDFSSALICGVPGVPANVRPTRRAKPTAKPNTDIFQFHF
jgi:hypothetical protein